MGAYVWRRPANGAQQQPQQPAPSLNPQARPFQQQSGRGSPQENFVLYPPGHPLHAQTPTPAHSQTQPASQAGSSLKRTRSAQGEGDAAAPAQQQENQAAPAHQSKRQRHSNGAPSHHLQPGGAGQHQSHPGGSTASQQGPPQQHGHTSAAPSHRIPQHKHHLQHQRPAPQPSRPAADSIHLSTQGSSVPPANTHTRAPSIPRPATAPQPGPSTHRPPPPHTQRPPHTQASAQTAPRQAPPPAAHSRGKQGGPAAQSQADGAADRAAQAAILVAKQAELEALRSQLQQREQRIAQQKEQAAREQAAKDAAKQQQKAEMQKRKAQLEKGFRAMAPASAPNGVNGPSNTAGAAAGEGGTKITFAVADELELERVLDAKSDLECLKLKPGASLDQVRRSFKAMAMAVHPDKCSLPGAAEAFQRLSAAYNRLNKQPS